MRNLLALAAIALTGCAAPIVSYVPREGQSVVYTQGVGTITAQTDEATIMMYPTFQYQSLSDVPTFTLMVQNTTNHDIDFNPETLTASVDNQQCHVYSLAERVSEIRTAARRKQIALAIAGGLAAGAAAYGASHQTATYSNATYTPHGAFYSSGTIQVFDPAAGIFAGAAVGAATGVGIHQIARAAGYQEQAAQGIFQRTTIRPGTTAVGQIELRTPTSRFAQVNVGVPIDGAASELQFVKKSTR